MNVNKMRASALRHAMEMGSQLDHNNPYHTQHIRDFCDYAEAVADGAAEEVMQEIPAAVQKEVGKQLACNKVQVEIDKQSMKKAQKAIDELLSPLKTWFK